MIKIEHTLFSLPFALSSAALALNFLELEGRALDFTQLAWRILFICLALLGARSAGMALNRIIDKDIDALNPRTADRELPAAKISLASAWVLVLVSLLLYFWAAMQLPKLCLYLSPIPLIWVFSYPYFKRFSILAHFFLGTTLGGATLGAWIAITGAIDNLAPLYLAFAVCFWVTGFDIIYSTQDIDFDKAQGLHSIPSRYGMDAAIRIAKLCHFLAPLLLYLCGEVLALGLVYKLGILAVIAALVYEQQLVKAGKIETAFFTINTWISVLIFVSILLDLSVR